MSYLKHIQVKIRHDHPLGVILDILDKAGIKIVPYYLFMEKLTEGGQPHLEAGFDDYSTTFLDSGDMKVIAEIPARNTSEEQLMQRLKEGQMCFGAKKRGQLIAFTWVDLHECHYKGYRFLLKEDEAYLFDAHTLMSFRGKGIAPYTRYELNKELDRLNIKRLYSISNRLHTSSVKFKMKLNAKAIDWGIHVELFKKWHFSTKAKGYRD